MVANLVTLGVLVVVLRIAIRGRRPAPFSGRRAAVSMRTATGANTGAVLAAVVVAQTGVDVVRRPEVAATLGATAAVAVMIALVFAVAVDDRRGGLLLTVVGVAAALTGTMLDLGPAGALLTLALSLPLI